MRLGSARLAAALLAAALGAGAASAEELREESVGVVPITAETSTPRDDALRAAVQAAVVRAARGLLPDGGADPSGVDDDAVAAADARFAERLGDPFAFATRFRILEDRGRRPAVFTSDPEVENEYVVVAEVTLDAGAIRERLVALGLLASHRGGASRSVRLEIEGLAGYRPFALLRQTLLDDTRVRSARPVEFGPSGRAVLAVEGDRDAPGLVAELQRRAPQGLRILPLEQSSGAARLRVEWTAPPPPETGVDAEPEDPGAGEDPLD